MDKEDIGAAQQFAEALNLTKKPKRKLIATEQAIYLAPRNDKVSIIICARGGFEAMAGPLLGDGLADAVISATELDPYTIMRNAIAVNNGRGILFLCSYESAVRDVVLSAGGLLEEAGFGSEVVFMWDDISPGAPTEIDTKHASTGVYFCTKIAGAAAAQGLSLKEVYYITREARDLTRSISFGSKNTAARSCCNSLFYAGCELGFGLGLPEDDAGKGKRMRTVREMVEEAVFHMTFGMRIRPGDEICAHISGVGGLCFSDLCQVACLLQQVLKDNKMSIYDMVIDPTPLRSSTLGVTISLLHLTTDMKGYYAVSYGLRHEL